MTNKFKIPNRDFVIWALEFCRSTLPHYTHKLMGSGCKPEPAGKAFLWEATHCLSRARLAFFKY
ncbi:hypothetical protein KsCSTR_33100 [Candidatus Kuenenia stuttgartiensis]|uniref:Uncharacterized protein n=1 Tax=Kuenenia stuttgartiensis TaxID=174633 RepID=Q1Q4H2_KUEST|nr:hypothetical protein KsCSTR_33100 [Candidatus Kuenenia stuttgartiensis]CAJ74921.1 unknown protein [Candidatus Kuenenia stuttgartiensis]